MFRQKNMTSGPVAFSRLPVIDQNKSGQANNDSDDLVPGDRLMIEQIPDKDQDHSQYS